MAGQGAADCTDKWEDYHQELVSLLSWLGPHIAKRNNQGSTLQNVERVVPIITMIDKDSLRTTEKDDMEPHMGGATT